MNKNYSIGLDIGTNSVGWAVIADDLQLIRKRMKINGNTDIHSKKKNFWGVRLFEAGETAENRRLKRTTRRRYRRRKQRLLYLQDIFNEEISKIDPNFFHRLDESFYVEEDKTGSKHPVFGSLETEVDYHHRYPTIYHLRKELVDSTTKADLRLIYLALAHIVKYRGHFLIEGEFSIDNLSISEAFSEFLLEFNKVFNENEQHLSADTVTIEKILKEKVSRTHKAETILKCFPSEKSNSMFGQFIKMIVGNQANFKKVFGLVEDAKLQFSKEEYEEDLEQLINQTEDIYLDVFIAAKKVYDAIELSGVINDNNDQTKAKLSSQMINFYEDHHTDLHKLKKFIKNNQPESYHDFFNNADKNGYAGYIDGKTTQEKFYQFLKKELPQTEETEYFLDKIEREIFLRKQRSFYNGVIPHQIHLNELCHIINKQSHYYSFLAEEKEKIEKIFTFRIPYYVGPLANGNSDFAWIVRKNSDTITPWNFDEMVERDESAKKFIERMTNFDTYLPQEKVLPVRSLIYQKYTIFNELTKVSYIDDRGVQQNFSSEEKIAVFNELFKKNNKVSTKKLIAFLRNNYHIESADIKGIEDSFNASYSTYRDLAKIEGMQTILDNEANESLVEDIIKILTIFEDRKMRKVQLEKFDHTLSNKLINQLSRKHYTGWGRLSAKLLTGIRDNNSHKTLMEYLIDDDGPDESRNINRNLMQLINDDTLSFKKTIAEAQVVDKDDDLSTIVSQLPGSPAIKKGILQSLKIVNEIVDIMGYKPSHIVVEMARENQTTSQGRNKSKGRYIKLAEGLKNLGSKILTEEKTTNIELQKDRLFLYYLQNGKDMYSGEDLDINQLSKYDIDHIIPQSFTTDNSIDNKVLVSSNANRGNKGNDVPSINVVKRQNSFWRALKSSGLISERKHQNLTKVERGGLTENDKARFLNRQLVETRQITKHVASLLDNHFNTQLDENENIIREVKIVTLKSSLTSQFRKEFELYKVRSINDHHHAHDAYLNAVIANKILKVYPQLQPEFVYGEFTKSNMRQINKATVRKQRMSNIMKFFANKDRIVTEDGEIVWDKAKDIQTIKRTLNFNQVNVVKKTEIQTGSFSKETVLPKGNSEKLIPRKKKLSTEKYGGFIEPVVAYSVAITYEKKKSSKRTQKIIGISIMERALFEKDEVTFLETNGYKNPTVMMKLPKYTLYETSDGRKRWIASANEAQKANQMVLPQYLVTLLYHSERYDEVKYPTSYEYVNNHIDDYSVLLLEVEAFANKYTLADKNLNLVKELYNIDQSISVEEKAKSFIELMTLNASGAPSDFNFYNKKVGRKRYTSVTEIWDSSIIHQSITGLYETRINLKED